MPFRCGIKGASRIQDSIENPHQNTFDSWMIKYLNETDSFIVKSLFSIPGDIQIKIITNESGGKLFI